MSSALDSNLKQKISTLLTEAKSGGGLLKCMNQIYAMLRSEGLMWKAILHCRHVGCHENNRDGLGIAPDHVHQLAQDFFEFGYVEGECHRMAVELHGPKGDATRKYNEELVNQSNGLLLHRHWMNMLDVTSFQVIVLFQFHIISLDSKVILQCSLMFELDHHSFQS